MDHEVYMKEALKLAEEAARDGDVPVGCVITRNGEIIGRGRNRRESSKNALAHAEIEAINEACRKLGGWRLTDCDLYVTLEPCPMCAGAIINARISKLVYGAREENTGACASVINLFEERFGHKPAIYGGVLAEECAGVLAEFFRKMR